MKQTQENIDIVKKASDEFLDLCQKNNVPAATAFMNYGNESTDITFRFVDAPKCGDNPAIIQMGFDFNRSIKVALTKRFEEEHGEGRRDLKIEI